MDTSLQYVKEEGKIIVLLKAKINLQTDRDEPADQNLICCLKQLSVSTLMY